MRLVYKLLSIIILSALLFTGCSNVYKSSYQTDYSIIIKEFAESYNYKIISESDLEDQYDVDLKSSDFYLELGISKGDKINIILLK